MSHSWKVLAAVAALFAAGRANAQGVVTQKNLSLGLAQTIAEAALGACREKGFHTAVAVVDRAGQLLVLLRDEQATAATIEMARRKAYTARMFRMSMDHRRSRQSAPTPRLTAS